MKDIIQKYSLQPGYIKAFEWVKIVTITGTTQLLVQAIGFISGIIVIRLLPQHEYALYTIANTMLGTMTILADGGIQAGVLSEGGKVWQNRTQLGTVLVTGLNLRRKFALLSLTFSIPILLFLLRYHHASWLVSCLIVLSLIPAFLMSLSGLLFEIAPKLYQDIVPLQKNRMVVNTLRLAFITITLFIFPWAFIAILAAGLPQIWANFNLRKISRCYADWHQKPDAAISKNILTIVRRVLPGSIYYCLSGQITIWLISFFGNSESVAQAGALGRLAVAIGMIMIVIATIVVPRFARLENNSKTLFKKYFQFQVAIIMLSLFIVLSSLAFPNYILIILGQKYENLTYEVVLTVICACANLLTASAYALNSSRGIILNPLISISGELALLIILVNVLSLNSLKGVILLGIIINCFNYILQLINFVIQTKKR